MDDFAGNGFARKGLLEDDWPDDTGSGDAFKEFQGRDLDSAIEEACVYFNVGRERLEIEIVQDARSGLFGLIGARKAKIRARRAHLRDTVKSVLGELHSKKGSRFSRRDRDEAVEHARGLGRSQKLEPDVPAKTRKARRGAPERDAFGTRNRARGADDQPARPSRSAQTSQTSQIFRGHGSDRQAGGPWERSGKPLPTRERKRDAGKRAPEGQESSKPSKSQKAVKPPTPAGTVDTLEDGGARPTDSLPLWNEAAGERLADLAATWANRLLEKLVGHPCAFEHRVEGHLGQVDIRLIPTRLDTPEGLPKEIARDADVMGAVEHLASRLLSREARLAAKVVIDTGLERERCDDNRLRQAALELAKRALTYDKPQTTEPLSSQERRIVHVPLKDVAGIHTKSLGKGYLRRVLVAPKRPGFEGHAAWTDDLSQNHDASLGTDSEVPAPDVQTGAENLCGLQDIAGPGLTICPEKEPFAPAMCDAVEPDVPAPCDAPGATNATSKAGETIETGNICTADDRKAEQA